jgi:hypothetical protein
MIHLPGVDQLVPLSGQSWSVGRPICRCPWRRCRVTGMSRSATSSRIGERSNTANYEGLAFERALRLFGLNIGFPRGRCAGRPSVARSLKYEDATSLHSATAKIVRKDFYWKILGAGS